MFHFFLNFFQWLNTIYKHRNQFTLNSMDHTRHSSISIFWFNWWFQCFRCSWFSWWWHLTFFLASSSRASSFCRNRLLFFWLFSCFFIFHSCPITIWCSCRINIFLFNLNNIRIFTRSIFATIRIFLLLDISSIFNCLFRFIFLFLLILFLKSFLFFFFLLFLLLFSLLFIIFFKFFLIFVNFLLIMYPNETHQNIFIIRIIIILCIDHGWRR